MENVNDFTIVSDWVINEESDNPQVLDKDQWIQFVTRNAEVHIAKAIELDFSIKKLSSDIVKYCYLKPKNMLKPTDPLNVQVGGDHYKTLVIQPVEYIYKNNIPYLEGNVIKYVTRWKAKGGIKDLEKAKHYIELLIQFESEK